MASSDVVQCGLVFGVPAETQIGEIIRVVGEAEELGKWNPEKSVQLYTDGRTYPFWSTTNPVWIRFAGGQKPRVEYKYLRDRRRLGGGFVWEDDIANRCVSLPHTTPSRPGGRVWVVTDRLWNAPGELKLRPGSRNGSFEGRRPSNPPPLAEDQGSAVSNELFTPTQRFGGLSGLLPVQSESPGSCNIGTMAAALRSRSASLLEEPLAEAPQEEAGEEEAKASVLQREASGSRLCCHVNELRRESSQNLLAREASVTQMSTTEGDEEVAEQQPPSNAEPGSFEATYMLLGEEPLGEGSFGLVWRCQRWKCDGDAAAGCEERAAKRIAKARLAPRDVRNLFGDGKLEGEIKMHLGLTHPHVVKLYEVFEDADVVSLVMERCNGGDLFDLIASHADKGGLTETCSARVQVHLLSALAFLHDIPVVHRDVKCENVLLSQKGIPPEQNTYKLCDFGFAARPEPPEYRLSTRMGSPDTVAPEVVRGHAYWTPVDCWAAGVLLYMSLSATPPFYATSDAEVLQKVKHCLYKMEGSRWEHVSGESKSLIRQLMCAEQSSRATAQQALQHPFLKRYMAQAELRQPTPADS